MEYAGKRLDQALSAIFPQYSRSRLQKWNKSGHVLVDDAVMRGKDSVLGGEQIEITVAYEEETQWRPQDIPLHIVYQDDSIIVINKPAGLVVHPGAGNMDGTLANGLLYLVPELEGVPRAGVVHRLDKETSGLMVVAKTLEAQTHLVNQLEQRSVSRQYQAIVCGVMTAGGTVDKPIGRHPKQRLRMAVFEADHQAKEAITHYRVQQRYRAHTLVNLKLETGRTHQIRVHMEYIHYPIVGDPVYGGRLKLPRQASESFVTALRQFKRQALHAAGLGLIHPKTNEPMQWQAELPEDMKNLIRELEQDLKLHETNH